MIPYYIDRLTGPSILLACVIMYFHLVCVCPNHFNVLLYIYSGGKTKA